MAKKKRKKNGADLDPALSRGIISILLLIFACIITLSFFGRAGDFGEFLNEGLLSSLFGNIRFATPIVILAFAFYTVKDSDYDYRSTHGIGALLFFVTFASLLHIGFEVDDMWLQALAGNGGGVFGMLAWVLKSYMGAIASIILLIGLLLVSILLIFNTTVTHFILLHRKLFEGLGWIGKTAIRAVSTLFVRSTDTESTDEYEDEFADEDGARVFADRPIGSTEEQAEETAEPQATPTPTPQATRTTTQADSPDDNDDDLPDYAKNVIVKDVPPLTLLRTKKGKPSSGDIKSTKEIIADTYKQFNIDVTLGEVRVGPSVTQYTLKPPRGVKVSRLTNLTNDLALALAAHPIRIEAPIPGKSLVGIEIPNTKTAMVTLKELLESKQFQTRKHNMAAALGRDVAGIAWFADIKRMPHLLVAGATGSGKTVCVNTILMSLLFQNTAEDLRFIMVDPKRVELTFYNGIPHLLTPVITDTRKTVNALNWTISEMERRFEVLSKAGNRDIHSYNAAHPDEKLPYIVFVIDELADLMATAGNEVEAGIIRIAQMARAVGIHLIVATQRPSVDVITGLMKANIPARIAFSVASITDSRTILDSPGAEKLIGRGDMLFQTAELSKPVRVQGAFISENEMRGVIDYLKSDEEPEYDESIVSRDGSGTQNMFGGPSDDRDPFFHDAQHTVVEAKKASASLLQRKLRVGYARAARILDELEEAGIVGPPEGSKPRDVLVTTAEQPATMDSGQEANVYGDDESSATADQPVQASVQEEEIVEETAQELSTPNDEVDTPEPNNQKDELIQEETSHKSETLPAYDEEETADEIYEEDAGEDEEDEKDAETGDPNDDLPDDIKDMLSARNNM